jgi:hypothetical protein
MLATGTSNLAHASGHPFLVGLPLAPVRAALRITRGPGSALLTPEDERPAARAQSPAPRASAAPAAAGAPADREAKARWLPWLALYVSVANHLLALVATAVLYLILRAVFAPATAVVGAVLYGVNPWSVQWATLSRPEGTQADLIVLLVAALYLAYRATAPSRKVAGYAAAAGLLTLAVLVKYNAVLLATLPALVLLADRVPWGLRARALAWALALALAGYWTFIALYHRPSTGTWKFAYARGHNLYERLRRSPVTLDDPENGPASKTLAILLRVLPPEPPFCCGPTLMSRVDWVPAAERAIWRERWLPLLRRRDPATLTRLWLEVRGRPPGKVLTLHYHLGLAEADALLRDVFAEAVQARPGAYWRGTATLFARVFVTAPEVLVPVLDPRLTADAPLAVLADPGQRSSAGWGFARHASGAYRSRVLDYKGEPALWVPGMALVTQALGWTRLPPPLWWLLALAGVALAPARGDGADPPVARWGPLLVLIALLAYLAGWSLVFEVRTKDLRLVEPLLHALVAIGIMRLVHLVRPRAMR